MPKANLFSTVWEEAEHSAPEALTIAQDLCISLWKELRLLNAKHKELHDTLRGLLDQYFTEVPSTFLASAKAKLVPESIQLIRCIVTSLTDEEVSIRFSILALIISGASRLFQERDVS